MVLCCVPSCGSESNRCESSVTFHEFPSDPALVKKWVHQINIAGKSNLKEPWSPKGETVICSKHFLQTDFHDVSDTLKPFSLPTVFGHKYVGFGQAVDEDTKSGSSDIKKAPLIVKVIRPFANDGEVSSVASKETESRRTTPPKNTSSAIPSSSKLQPKFTKILLPSSTKCIRNQIQNPTSSSLSKPTGNTACLNSALKSLQPGNAKVGSRSVFLPTKGKVPSNRSVPVIPKPTQSKSNVNRVKKKGSPENNLIEIGPNTFLKINPEVIKVNKKQTPSGNTVLQFIMSQKSANSGVSDMLPKLLQSVTNSGAGSLIVQKSAELPKKEPTTLSNGETKDDPVVQHVVGHLVDTHVCKDSCDKLDDEDLSCDDMVLDDGETIIPDSMEIDECVNSSFEASSEAVNEGGDKGGKSSSNVLNKAPVLFTTNVPLSHCMMDKPKFLSQLRQKSRQIASLKFKIASLNKKIEDLEDRCIVQERQLSYSFIKRLKAIRKAASSGDACATYILEQIRCYSGKTKMRWSDTTLAQCAVWCRKAPYAYEYFKKADFFKLPCLGTVKRFMKKHPELKLQGRTNGGNPDNSSSSDFDFDDSDSDNDQPDQEKNGPTSTNATVLTNATMVMSHSIETSVPSTSVQGMLVAGTDDASKDKSGEVSGFPVAMDGSGLEIQEIILPSGEVVQCYSSSLCNGDLGNQYYIIPNVGDQTQNIDQEYNVVTSGESLPVILQNLDNAQLPLPQEQLIFITNSADQVECSESEVITS